MKLVVVKQSFTISVVVLEEEILVVALEQVVFQFHSGVEREYVPSAPF